MHHWNDSTAAVFWTVAGPAALGAAIGLPFGARCMVTTSLVVPALVLGLTALMSPALYIGTTLVGAAPPASRVAATMGKGLVAAGCVMAGLTPAAAFLGATARGLAILYGALVVAGGVLAGLRAVGRDLAAEPATRRRALPIFAVWAAVSLALGAHLFVHLIPA